MCLETKVLFEKSNYSSKITNLISSDNILFKTCSDLANLTKTLQDLKQLITSQRIKLLVVDSIGAFFKGNENEEENNSIQDYQNKTKIGHLLNILSQDFSIAVLVLVYD